MLQVANFRDVGAYINLILERKVLKEGVLFRGGKIDYADLKSIASPRTIINLRRGKDPVWAEVVQHHYPTLDSIDSYDTEQKRVQRWILELFKVLAHKDLKLPIYIHCAAGKDRTGIIIAVLLLVLKIPHEAIVEEYMLSEGRIERAWIMRAVEGVGDPSRYLRGVDTELLKGFFLQ